MPRETQYLTPAEIRQVETMAGLGMPVDQIACVLGISKASFDRRQADQPELSEALSNGRAKASLQVRQTLFKMATSGKCPAMTAFWMKVREGWKEPVAIEHSGPDGRPIETATAVKVLITLPDNGRQAPDDEAKA